MTVVTFGEIMLRLAPPVGRRLVNAPTFDVTYGGGEANVALGLAQLGVPSRFVTRLPENELGDGAIRALRAGGVQTSAIYRGGDRMGLYFLERGVAQRGSAVLYDRAGSGLATIPADAIDWGVALEGADWFHLTGITPAVSAAAAEAARIGIDAARARGLTVSIDLNYRSRLWQWGRSAGEVMAGLVASADVIVGNEEDAARIFGIEAPQSDVVGGRLDHGGYADVAARLLDRFPSARAIAVTLRSSRSASHDTWAAGLLLDGEFVVSRSHDILPVLDRVGAGDAFAAALIFGLRSQPRPSPTDIVEFAVAASCLKHGFEGDANLATRAEIERLMGGDGSGRVRR